MSDVQANELPKREGVYSEEEWEIVIVAYDEQLLMTRAEWEASMGIQAAPLFIYPDDQGGYVSVIVDDADLVAVATQMAEANNWNDEERDGLYEAMCDFMALLAPVDAVVGEEEQ